MGEAVSLSRRLAQAGAAVAACLLVANCSSSSKLTSRVDPRYGVAASPRVVEPGHDEVCTLQPVDRAVIVRYGDGERAPSHANGLG